MRAPPLSLLAATLCACAAPAPLRARLVEPVHGASSESMGRGRTVVGPGERASLWFRCPGGAVGLAIDDVLIGETPAGFDVGLTRWLTGPPGVDLSASRRIELADGATALLRLGPAGHGRLVLVTARAVGERPGARGVLRFDQD